MIIWIWFINPACEVLFLDFLFQFRLLNSHFAFNPFIRENYITWKGIYSSFLPPMRYLLLIFQPENTILYIHHFPRTSKSQKGSLPN